LLIFNFQNGSAGVPEKYRQPGEQALQITNCRFQIICLAARKIATKTKAEAPADNGAKAAGVAAAPRPAGEKAPVFLMDAMSFIFRAYHAMARQKGMSTRTGIPTSATYVFVNMLRKLREDFHPEYLAAVFDVAAPTFRDQQASQIASVRKWDIKTQQFQEVTYGGYKANRAEMPGDLAQQLPYIRRALEAYRIPILEMPGFEADDVIGTLARQAAEQGHPVYVVSSDKDMLQLVNDHVCVLNPPKDNLICDRAKVEEILGVPPERVVDVMALRGDTIDNIPGAPGIGDKGSVELIRQFGSVEAALDRAEEVQKKTYRESLLNNRDTVLFSKQMATIDCNVPVTLDLEAMRTQEPDAEAARALFTELEFTSLIKEFLPSVEVSATDYRDATSAADVTTVLSQLSQGGVLALAVELPAEIARAVVAEAEQLEPAEENGSQAQLLLGNEEKPSVAISPVSRRVERLAISAKPGTAVVVAVSSDAGEILRAAIADASLPKAVHDLKLATRALWDDGRGIELAGVRDEPMLYSYLLDSTYSSHTLAEIALRRFNLKLQGGLAEAADLTGRLAAALRRQVEAAGLLRVYEEIDLPLVPVLARMEQAGVKIDCGVLQEMSHRLERECDLKAREIWQLAGEEFNINSPRQLGRVLFEKLGLPKPVKYGKGKTISTAVDVLEGLSLHHAVPRLVLEYRQLSKLKSTYVDALPLLLNPGTQRLHTTFDQTNTATGRLSSKNPNLQNIPIRTELGREIRAAFIAEPGHVLLSADYSQVELRLLAHFSGDRLLLDAFQRGDDIHTLTAAEVFGVPPRMVTPEHRRRAKAINFGIPYGLSPFGLSQQLGIETSEAKQYIDAYFQKYKAVRAWLDATIAQARQTQKVETMFGRVRPIPDINSKNASLRGSAERTAVNTPLQGTAADLIKRAMIRLDREILARGLKSRMTLQVHDELVFEVPDAELKEMRALVRDQMENVHKLNVPLVVEIGVGRNWRDLE
jgi:DNA polymerase-1